MHSWRLVILLIAATATLSAQTSNKSSELIKKLNDYPSVDSGYVDLLNEIAWSYLNVNLQESHKYIDKIEAISKEIGYDIGLGDAHNLRGGAYWHNGENALALKEFKQAQVIFEAAKNERKSIVVRNNIGLIHSNMNQFYEAYKMHKEAYERASKIGYQHMRFIAWLNTTDDLFKNSDFESAKTYGAELYAATVEMMDEDIDRIELVQCNSIYVTLRAHLMLGNINGAQKWAIKAQSILNEEDIDPYRRAQLSIALGELENEKGNYRKATEIILSVLKDLPKDQFKPQLTNLYVVLLKAQHNLREYDLSIQYGLAALELSEQINGLSDKIEIHDYLSRNYSALDDYDQAVYHSLQHRIANDSMISIVNNNRMIEVEYNEQINAQALQNEILSAQNQVSSTKIKQRNSGLIALGSLSALLLGGIFYFKQANKTARIEISEFERVVHENTKDLSKINVDLMEKNDDLERFTYVASHDLKEPLRNINSYVKLIELKNKENIDPNHPYLKFVKTNTYQMQSLVGDLLEYSRLPQIEMEEKVINISDIAERIFYSKRHPTAVLNYSGQKEVKTSPEIINIVFDQIIDNAIKFNNSEPPIVEVSYNENERVHFITISDNGIGIAPHYHDKIFEIFKRLHTLEKYQGTGVGLAMCRKILTMVGGSIGVSSSEGNGAIFTITIPKKLHDHILN